MGLAGPDVGRLQREGSLNGVRLEDVSVLRPGQSFAFVMDTAPCPGAEELAHGVDVLVAGRPLTSPVLTSAGALEVTVHGWDVAVACGTPRPIPEPLAKDLLPLAPVLVTERDRLSRFGPALDPPVDATTAERLLAFLGRSPR